MRFRRKCSENQKRVSPATASPPLRLEMGEVEDRISFSQVALGSAIGFNLAADSIGARFWKKGISENGKIQRWEPHRTTSHF